MATTKKIEHYLPRNCNALGARHQHEIVSALCKEFTLEQLRQWVADADEEANADMGQASRRDLAGNDLLDAYRGPMRAKNRIKLAQKAVDWLSHPVRTRVQWSEPVERSESNKVIVRVGTRFWETTHRMTRREAEALQERLGLRAAEVAREAIVAGLERSPKYRERMA